MNQYCATNCARMHLEHSILYTASASLAHERIHTAFNGIALSIRYYLFDSGFICPPRRE